ncbi:cob(I)yrinic acid a,c-diamide adenosyltransferase [Polluticaenibacter yanchengensis]|uniref:Corrinoid adenosyltransferase n=1 Tax=Polluticaenibacter yanchengensis TaxID=3014562 RepID=A0ABT4ULA9_9BACT|nr:cob(I)yrinic acid a,c-diamide adenosyltransferase [Chitinophagaceae bacterium LY-5]
MATKIYTKTGDRGYTALVGGEKILKSDLQIDAYGSVDELNAHTGMLRDLVQFDEDLVAFLKKIQNQLFVVGANLAISTNKEIKMALPKLSDEHILALENEIDRLTLELEPLKNFTIPGGHVAISQAHICRVVCRRAERLVVAFNNLHDNLFDIYLRYLNRLSDYFYTLTRFLSKQLKAEESIWEH